MVGVGDGFINGICRCYIPRQLQVTLPVCPLCTDMGSIDKAEADYVLDIPA